jgi:nicotinamide-nucleotide amidase
MPILLSGPAGHVRPKWALMNLNSLSTLDSLGHRMSNSVTIDIPLAKRVADMLIDRGQTLAVSESSTGGLIAAALLSVPGASAFFLGGGVVYTAKAREMLLGITPSQTSNMRSATQEMAHLLAATVQTRLGADWGLAETGATGPSGNRYGDAAGHCCLAITGLRNIGRVLETGSTDRIENMVVFANAALVLLEQALAGR